MVTGETSAFVAAAEPVVAFLNHGGTPAEHLHLPDHGVTGNGHGLIYVANSDNALRPVPAWMAVHAAGPAAGAEAARTGTTTDAA